MSNPTRKSNAGSNRTPAVPRKQPERTTPAQRAVAAKQTGLVVRDLKPIHRSIPYKRNFLNLTDSAGGSLSQDQGFFKKVRGLFEGARGAKGLSKDELIRLRQTIGDLKAIIPSSDGEEEGAAPEEEESSRPKTKKELLEEKRKSLGEQSKSEKKRQNPGVGMRIEIEKLKKAFPGDPNLVILSAVLTAQDSISPHRSAGDRISSLHAALQSVASLVMHEYMTTYSVDVLCDIYFMYLEALKPKLMERLKATKPSESQSVRRDIHLLNMLLEHKRLKKTISNVAKKLDGFGYPYEHMSPLHIARTFQATPEEGDTKVGPGTVKLNKFLIRIYLNVFSQIPALMPIAKKICDVLPSNRQSRALIAVANIENAVMNMKVAKLNKSPDLPKLITTVYSYGKSFIGNSFAETVTSPLEAKILIRIAQMVEEMALLSSKLDPDVITYAYNCSTIALHYYKEEAEVLTRRISDIAARQRINLSG